MPALAVESPSGMASAAWKFGHQSVILHHHSDASMVHCTSHVPAIEHNSITWKAVCASAWDCPFLLLVALHHEEPKISKPIAQGEC